MLTLKLKALELVRDHDVYSAYSFRFSVRSVDLERQRIAGIRVFSQSQGTRQT